jgi:polar amino acid transport system substrate-binding protein
MTDTKERQDVLDFVDHSRTGLTIVVRAGNPEGVTTLLDLCGKTVAVQKGTTDELFLKATADKCSAAGKPTIDRQSYPKQSNAFLAVKSGKADANLVDGAVGGYAVRTVDGGGALEQLVDPKAPHGYRSNPIGIGMLKGQDDLRDAIEAALRAVMDSGVYDKLAKRWGMESTALDAPTVNAGT